MNDSSINIKKPIVLVGMMGVGKTTFGKKLAGKLGLTFFDLDHEIEDEIGHSVSWIFENAGENEFRKLESKKLREILNGELIVLALGGGAYISEENIKHVNSNSTSIWLRASAETIYKRVSYRNDRPLLEKIKNKRQHIKNMLEEREKFYKQADFSIYTDNGSHKEILQNIMKQICESY